MKTKPWTITVLALIHILAPVGNILANAVRSGRSIPEQLNYWFHVVPKPLLIIYLLIPILAGLFIYICRRWSYWAYVACIAVLFGSNIHAFMTSTTLLNFIFLCLALIIDVLVVAYFVVPSVRKVYFDPRVRWWETALRYTYSPDVQLNGHQSGRMNNISKGGLFVVTSAPLKEGDAVTVEWQDEAQKYHFKGHVVYVNPKAQGSGIQFEHDSESKAFIKKLTQDLDSKGLVIPDRLPGPADTFTAWLKRLVTTGEGLFPKP